MNKRITIIPDSGLVMVDGRGFGGLDMTDIPSNIHAVQWYGEDGEIEYKSHFEAGTNGRALSVKPDNERITSLDGFEAVIAAWEAAAFEADNPPPEPEPTPEELASRTRTERDTLLAASDWVVVKAMESGEPVPEALVFYRQALRDITSQPGFPESIDWPVMPE